MTDDISRRNARLVIAASFFGDFAFVLPIWLLYSSNILQFSNTLSILLFTGVWFVSAMFEIPTGALADRWGRRKSFMLGNALLLLFPLAYIFQAPLGIFFLFMVVAGFGNALTSGSLLPLVHESYNRAGLSKKAYNAFLSNSRTVLFIARALSGVTGAWLYTIQPYLPFLGWALAILCNILIGKLLVERRNEAINGSYRTHISTAMKAMMRSEIVVVMLASYIIMNIVMEAIWTGYQLFYEQDGRSAILIGLLFSMIAVISAGSAYFVRRAYVKYSPIVILFMGMCLASLTCLLLYQSDVTLRLLAVVPMAVASGMVAVTVSAVIQHSVPNKIQSTVLSVYGVITYVVYAVGSLLAGLMIDANGLDATRRMILLSSLVTLGVMGILTLRISRRNTFRLEEQEA